MKKIALFTFLTLLLCTSCVTKKKFMMTEAARIASIDSLQSLLTDCRNTGDQYRRNGHHRCYCQQIQRRITWKDDHDL